MATLEPEPSGLGEALTAPAAAAVALRATRVPQVPQAAPWTVIGQITPGGTADPIAGTGPTASA